MVPARGREEPSVSELLAREAYRFDFFQALRILERSCAPGAELTAGGSLPQPIGFDGPPAEEVARLRAFASLTFPAGSLCALEQRSLPGEDAEQLQLLVSFFGLTGPMGALPDHYTRLLMERIREKDFAMCDFLDLFNHRLLSLFYRAWRKYRFHLGYEAWKLGPPEADEDQFTRSLFSLVGLGTGGLRRRMEVDDEAVLFYGGHFAHSPRSVVALEGVLCDYFDVAAEVQLFQGQWLTIAEHDRSILGTSHVPEGWNCQLGVEAVIGERVWNLQSRFRVRLGPLTYRRFRAFMPCGDALLPLCQLVRLYGGSEFDFDAQAVLLGREAPWCHLGGDDSDPSFLGWNTWIRSRPFNRDVSDAVFSLPSV